MTFRIHKTIDKRTVTLSLSGRLNNEGIEELRRLFDHYTETYKLVLDLNDVQLVESDAIRELTNLVRNGIRLINSPMYVSDWISIEAGEGRA